jgi:hypothetical protein
MPKRDTPAENKRSSSLGKGKSSELTDINPSFLVGTRKPVGPMKEPKVVDMKRVQEESLGFSKKKKK